jgi:hypothetical protein
VANGEEDQDENHGDERQPDQMFGTLQYPLHQRVAEQAPRRSLPPEDQICKGVTERGAPDSADIAGNSALSCAGFTDPERKLTDALWRHRVIWLRRFLLKTFLNAASPDRRTDNPIWMQR